MVSGSSGKRGTGDFYSSHDRQRQFPEQHSSRRSDFARDRARVLHSAALRRLAAKTQVLSPTADHDFARNRLTHSLEVAQVGRELATSLGIDPDLVDTACLAHDLGHPPFGHNGERALAQWAHDIGGFEGNAQTLRIVTHLEPKILGPNGESFGLNLTRASLDASCKYPWTAQHAPELSSSESGIKFGSYSDDYPVFLWLREGAPEYSVCIEAQAMNLADDIAYSVHDYEDAILNGYLDLVSLNSLQERGNLIDQIASWATHRFSTEELASAFIRLQKLVGWPTEWDSTRLAQARLKNFTSQLIGRFAAAATAATREAYAAENLLRYHGNIVVPREVEAEIAVLKGIVAAFVLSMGERQPIYRTQRELLCELAEVLSDTGDQHLEPALAEDWRVASSDSARKRVIVDQIASLTDQSAALWHDRLVRSKERRI